MCKHEHNCFKTFQLKTTKVSGKLNIVFTFYVMHNFIYEINFFERNGGVDTGLKYVKLFLTIGDYFQMKTNFFFFFPAMFHLMKRSH